MISHELKCIFIHIPRCAGTSVEHWLTGKDWWRTDPATKHLVASQARSIYRDVWDDYFKFAIVREPVARTLSCLKFKEHFGLAIDKAGVIDFDRYHALFGEDIVIEHDHRFSTRTEICHTGHRPGQIFGNILDVPLDFIAHYETLGADMARIARHLGVRTPFETHVEQSLTPPPPSVPSTLERIAMLYSTDFGTFGYEPPI